MTEKYFGADINAHPRRTILFSTCYDGDDEKDECVDEAREYCKKQRLTMEHVKIKVTNSKVMVEWR